MLFMHLNRNPSWRYIITLAEELAEYTVYRGRDIYRTPMFAFSYGCLGTLLLTTSVADVH